MPLFTVEDLCSCSLVVTSFLCDCMLSGAFCSICIISVLNRFKDIFQEVFEKEWEDKFKEAGIWSVHTV